MCRDVLGGFGYINSFRIRRRFGCEAIFVKCELGYTEDLSVQGLSGWAWGQFGCTNLLVCADGMCAQASCLLLLWDLAVNSKNFSNIFPLEFSC